MTAHQSSGWNAAYLRDRGPAAADPERFAELMRHQLFPRASAYDPVWVDHNHMGPNALWLMDWLCQHVEITPSMRVLDLGCGSAMTSIFIAREFGARVWAADLWIEPSENLARIEEAGVADRVVPIEAEAHSLPFAAAFFDAIVSVDSYHYYGTDMRYLSYLSQFVKPGGLIGVVVPGNSVDPDDRETDDVSPPTAAIGADWFTFRSAAWWARHWTRTRGVVVEAAKMLTNGWDVWWQFVESGAVWDGTAPEEAPDAPMLLAPEGRTLGFALVVARRTDEVPLTLGPGRFRTRLA